MVYVIVPRANDDTFNTCYVPGAQKHNLATFQIMDDKDEDGNVINRKTITQKYNMFFDIIAKQHQFNPEDIIVFCHEDVNVVDDNFIQKMETVFSMKEDIGVLGLAGTAQLDEACRWWASPREHLRGHLLQGNSNDNNSKHLVFGNVGYFNDLVVVDGFFMAFKYKYLVDTGIRFDESYECNDMYDLDICMTVLNTGYKVCIADILCYHKSEGMGAIKDTWDNAREKFIAKWKSNGREFPVKVCKGEDKVINIEV